MDNKAGSIIANSLARYDPFGNYRTRPNSVMMIGKPHLWRR